MPFKETGNALLGITELTDEELKHVIEGVMLGYMEGNYVLNVYSPSYEPTKRVRLQ